MITNFQLSILMLLIWIQTANQPLVKIYASFPMTHYGLRFLDLVMAFALLVFNVAVFESLKSSDKSTNGKSSFLVRLLYSIVIASYVICLSPSKNELSIGMLVLTFVLAIDWFDGFKDVNNSMVEKLNDYRTNRGRPIADQDASMGIFLLLPIDCVLIYLAAMRFF